MQVNEELLEAPAWVREFVPWTIVRFWGLFGPSSGATLPTALVVGGTAAYVVAWLVGFRRADSRTRALMLVLTSMLVIVALGLTPLGARLLRRLFGRLPWWLASQPTALLVSRRGRASRSD